VNTCIPAPGGALPLSPNARIEQPRTAVPRNSLKALRLGIEVDACAIWDRLTVEAINIVFVDRKSEECTPEASDNLRKDLNQKPFCWKSLETPTQQHQWLLRVSRFNSAYPIA